MKRFLREPLLHFVLLGILVFAFDAFLRGRAGTMPAGKIVVSAGRIENLAALFAKTWRRPPNARELRDLVDDYVLEEALYREGVALGVDQDDSIIRRRVRQKMEFFVDDIVEVAEPTEAELEAWLAENARSYARPSRFTFRQVYLNPDRRGDALWTDAQRMLAELRSVGGAMNLPELGDGSLLGYAHADAGAARIASSFGQLFADQLEELRIGEWSGPIESAFGVHLVFVDAKIERRLPALAEVREAVERDWRFARRGEASKGFHAEILARYRVEVEWPEDRLALPRVESDPVPPR